MKNLHLYSEAFYRVNGAVVMILGGEVEVHIIFSKCVNIRNINALWKISKNQILHGSSPLFFFFQRQLLILKMNQLISSNVKCFNHDSINCTFTCQGCEVILYGCDQSALPQCSHILK